MDKFNKLFNTIMEETKNSSKKHIIKEWGEKTCQIQYDEANNKVYFTGHPVGGKNSYQLDFWKACEEYIKEQYGSKYMDADGVSWDLLVALQNGYGESEAKDVVTNWKEYKNAPEDQKQEKEEYFFNAIDTYIEEHEYQFASDEFMDQKFDEFDDMVPNAVEYIKSNFQEVIRACLRYCKKNGEMWLGKFEPPRWYSIFKEVVADYVDDWDDYYAAVNSGPCDDDCAVDAAYDIFEQSGLYNAIKKVYPNFD